jgi:hypothetical protein
MNPNGHNSIVCYLTGLSEKCPATKKVEPGDRILEFHIHGGIRSTLGLDSALFKTSGNLIIPDFAAARTLAEKVRARRRIGAWDTTSLSAGKLNAMGLIDEILHIVFRIYRETTAPSILDAFVLKLNATLGKEGCGTLIREFSDQFPSSDVYRGIASSYDWLEDYSLVQGSTKKVKNRDIALEELILLKMANENPAFAPFRFFFDDGTREEGNIEGSLSEKTAYEKAFMLMEELSESAAAMDTPMGRLSLFELLRMPAKHAPESLEAQLRWIKDTWGAVFKDVDGKILSGLDLIAEEETPRFPPGRAPSVAYSYSSQRHEYEKFTNDRDWMPSTVLIAKNILVWLHQLSKMYGMEISRLDQIPDQELESLARQGINSLWLIGIWQRSLASEKIKRLCGNPEAAASAYSLFDYEIDQSLGGWDALDALRERCLWRGIHLAADMVPNHTGIDSAWVRSRPDLFIGTDRCPFPGYTFNGPDLSGDPDIGIWLEDHYYQKTDAAVVFKRQDRKSGEVRYIYHGNDGTGMAWNDTAQIDFLNPEARQAVKERILHVARHFSIIRFDAAMVLARQHVRRLWYPSLGSGGAIPSRSEWTRSDEAFDRAMPKEFWREVVDECAVEVPDTLLLAEAFWMMEGYFVRTLGMHRVYNSAFMNMLKEEKNSLYRLTIKNTQEFDRQILKRFVNFMSNPDEDTAISQFGSGDKYFGVCTLMATLPGLPMFGHGQIEGFTEKYGMEYQRAYREETPDSKLVERHEREIFPLLRSRKLFAGVDNFFLFDFLTDSGHVDENVFAYTNGLNGHRALVFFNNHWERTKGKISISSPFVQKEAEGILRSRTIPLAQALDIDPSPGHYIVAKEQKSGLWFIQRCETVHAQGWSAHLEGYQSLVFMDFSRLDDRDGSCARLHETLGGRGVADIDSALEEARHPELYHALGLCLQALGTAAHAFRSRQDKEDLARMQGNVLSNAESFFSRLLNILAESESSSPALDSAIRGRAWMESGLALLAKTGPEKDLAGSNGFEHLNTIFGTVKGSLSIMYFIFLFTLAKIHHGATRSESLTYLLDTFMVRRKMLGFAREWDQATRADGEESKVEAMDKIDISIACGLAFAFASRPMDTAKALPDIVEPKPMLLVSAKSRTLELLRWAQNDEGTRSILGIHTWNGVEYYNKEGFEALLALWPCFAILEYSLESKDNQAGHSDAGKKMSERIIAIREIALKAHNSAGYVFDSLISIIEGMGES